MATNHNATNIIIRPSEGSLLKRAVATTLRAIVQEHSEDITISLLLGDEITIEIMNERGRFDFVFKTVWKDK